ISAALPDLARECGPHPWRGGPDHINRGRYRHLVRLALHAQHCCEPLRQTRGALRAGIELTSQPPEPDSAKRVRTFDVTTSTHPSEVRWLGVLFMAVEVAHFDISRAATQTADARTRRRAGVRAIS